MGAEICEQSLAWRGCGAHVIKEAVFSSCLMQDKIMERYKTHRNAICGFPLPPASALPNISIPALRLATSTITRSANTRMHALCGKARRILSVYPGPLSQISPTAANSETSSVLVWAFRAWRMSAIVSGCLAGWYWDSLSEPISFAVCRFQAGSTNFPWNL